MAAKCPQSVVFSPVAVPVYAAITTFKTGPLRAFFKTPLLGAV